MSKNLIMTGAGYNSAGKFGSSLNAGSGATAACPISTTADFAYDFWFKKATANTSLQVMVGFGGGAWVGMLSGGGLRCTVGAVDMLSSVTGLDDGTWHHVEVNVAPYTAPGTNRGCWFFIDGVQAGYVLNAANTPALTDPLQFRTFGSGSTYDFTGEVDECAFWVGTRHAQGTTFTPPTAPYTGSEASLAALWHLNGDGLDSKSSAVDATAVTLSLSATSGVVGSAYTVTVGTNQPLTGAQSVSVAVTHSLAGAVTSSPVTLNSSTATATVTITPSAAGTDTITGAATGTPTLSNGTATYTASASATVPAAPTIGTAVAGNGYVDVYFTRNSNGGASVIDSTATLSTGQTTTGTSSPIRVTAPNGTAVTATVKDRNSVGSSAASAASNSVTPTASTATLDTTKMVLSPGNWNIGANSLKAVNAGAYFRTLFTGNACTLQFDMTGVTNPSRFWYRVDNGPMVQATVAASVVLAMRGDTTGWGARGGHLLEVVIKERTNYVEIWNNPAVLFSLSGIVLDAGATLIAPTDARPLKGLCFGDSITESQGTLDSAGDALLSYALHMRGLLGAEIGLVGFGGQGWTTGGGGNSPVFQNGYDQVYLGVPRSFAGLDFITVNQGTNDGGNNVTGAVTTFLNALLAQATLPVGCKIILMRPFNGTHASEIQAGIAACSAPARINYMDTTGFYNNANSDAGGSVHPYGNEGINHISPLVAASVRTVLASSAPTSVRTVTVSGLKIDAATLATGLTGVKVSLRDAAGPDLAGPLSYQSSTQTITGGVLSFAANTTLASGATGWVDIKAPGLHYCGQVTVP